MDPLLSAIGPIVSAGGPWGTLLLLIVLGARAWGRGTFVLRSDHVSRVDDLKAQLAVKDRQIEVLHRQKDQLLAGAQVSVQALEAIRRHSEETGDQANAA